jgi:transcriptional regulator with XRE-family HTH domain
MKPEDETPETSSNQPDWQTSVDQLYDRKTRERRPIREGDPQKYRQAAAEITARQSATFAANLDALLADPDQLIDDTTADFLPLTTGQYESLQLPLQSTGYAYWRQIVGETFLEHQIIPHDRASQRVEIVLGKAAWQILQQFGAEAAYVFLLLAAKATRTRNPWEELVELNTQDLLSLDIWEKDADQVVGRRLRTIGNLVELVCNLSLLVSRVMPETKRFKALRIPFWVMEEMEYSGRVSSSNDGYQPEESQDLSVRVGFGLWSEQFVDVSDEIKQEALGRFGYQSNSILQINPNRKPLAAKLAILLLLLNQSNPQQNHAVGALLELVESKATIIEMQRRRDRRNYYWSRWNTALHALQKLGWQIEFDSESYPEALRPAWHQTQAIEIENDDRWVNAWLQARIKIQPPQLPETPKPVSDLPLAERFTGRSLAQALELKGLSRSKLAEYLHLDRSMVTYWIKGSRHIQPHHREQICQLLGRELEQVLELVSSKDTDRPKKAPDSLEESRASKSCLFLDER